VTSRLIYVDVVVRDGRGQPVHGLTEQDFKIEEDGRAQKIDFFSAHAGEEKGAGAAPLALPPDEFSNVPARQGSPAVNMVLFDLLNTPETDQIYARRELLKFLRELPSGQQVALFILSDRLHVIQSFTSSSDRLATAAAAIDPKDFHFLRSPSQKMSDDDFLANFAAAMGRDPGRQIAHMQKDHAVEDARASDIRARMTMQAFAELARAVSGYPGRKNLFWLSETFPLVATAELQFNDLSGETRFQIADLPGQQDAADLIASAQIAVYPIHLGGLDTGGIGPEVSGTAEVMGMNATLQDQFAVRQQLRNTLNDLARQTGGEAFYGSNDFAGALMRGVRDGTNYYSLAYRPTNQQWDGKFRQIRVGLERKGYSLNYRRGYFAVPDTAQPTSVLAVLDYALQPQTPVSTMLLLHAKVYQMVRPERGVILDSSLDAGNVGFTVSPDGHHHARLMVKLVAFRDLEPQPAAVQQTAGTLDIDFDPAHYDAVRKNGIAFRPQLALPPGKYRLRLGVVDLSNGRVGTLDAPFVLKETQAGIDGVK
jgi:VWFA-related protein